MRRRSREDAGSFQVLEAIIVGTLMIGSVLFVTSFSSPSAPTENAHQHLEQSACDALNVLSELPASQSGYASMLEQVVTESLKGNPSNLTTRLTNYFSPGTRYQVYLNNGQADYSIYQNADTNGEAVSCTKLLDPHWSYEIVYPDILDVSGVWQCTISNVCSLSPGAANVFLIAVPIHDGFLDWSAAANSSKLYFQNGFPANMSRATTGVLYTAPNNAPVGPGITAEYINFTGGYVSGFDVPYTTTPGVTGYATYTTSYGGWGTTQTPETVTNNLPYPVRLPAGAAYYVNPANGISATLLSSLRSSNGVSSHLTIQGGKQQFTTGQDVKFNWDYSGVLGVGDVMQARDFRIWAPFGAVTVNFAKSAPNASENYTYHIPQNSLWGTYVADLQYNLTTALGKTQILHLILPFDIRPPAQFTGQTVYAPTPPVYRVELVAWYGDWK